MILGLIWRLILATQIATLHTTTSEFILGGDERQIDGGARHALLEWCRKRLAPYPKAHVDNFTSSWRNGMAFLGLLHSQNPQLFQFDAIDPNRAEDNLHLAFEIAEKEFGIPKLLEAGDVLSPNADERSIITYVSEFCKLDRFNKPEEVNRGRLLDEREQALAMREAELQKQAFEQSRHLKAQTEQQLAELHAKEQALHATSQQLSELEKQHKAELERALAMQREADLKMEQAANAGKAALAGQQAAEAERLRLAEMERNLKLQAQQLAAQQDQMSKQQQLEAIEKAFAEHANNVDRFIVEEDRKVNDPAATVATLEPIVKFGIPHGEELLAKLRGLAEQAGRAGLQANRFTHHTVLSLEERWKRFVSITTVKMQNLQRPVQQAPPPQPQQQPQQQYPQPPPQQQQPPPQQQYPQPPSQQQQYPQPPPQQQYPQPPVQQQQYSQQPIPPAQQQYPKPNGQVRFESVLSAVFQLLLFSLSLAISLLRPISSTESRAWACLLRPLLAWECLRQPLQEWECRFLRFQEWACRLRSTDTRARLWALWALRRRRSMATALRRSALRRLFMASTAPR